MDFFRVFAARDLRSEDFMLEDDIENPNLSSDSFLKFSERTNFSFPDVLDSSGLTQPIQESFGQTCIPNKVKFTQLSPLTLDFNSRVYNGQFSSTGDLFVCSSQDEIRVYEVVSPDRWDLVNSFAATAINWTITDLDISSDQSYVIYSSVCSLLNLVNIKDNAIGILPNGIEQRCINLNTLDPAYGIFSCKFSYNTKEVLLGTKVRTIEVFDLELQQFSYKAIAAHSDDINSVCFASENSPVIYSGSDDSAVKIWDTRAPPHRPVGVLIGHREGITCVNSKNNDINLVSNGKDQCIKLWDIRKKKNAQEYANYRRTHRYQMGFNYVFGEYPLANYNKNLSQDCSLLTFKGHSVLETLIRCYFSPLFSTGQRYVYTGSATGKVHIYDTYSGKTASVLLPRAQVGNQARDSVCRDASWHPYQPMLCASSFDSQVYQYVFESY